MKKAILILALLGFAMQAFSQDQIFEARVEKENVPIEVLKAIDVDFPDYIVKEYYTTPVHYVDQDVFLSSWDEPDLRDSFQVTLTSKGKEVTANYSEDGKLMSSMEKLKNVAPPLPVREAISKNFPGWTISEDMYHMKSEGKGTMKERYGFVIRKDGKKKTVYTDAKGNIIKGPKRMK